MTVTFNPEVMAITNLLTTLKIKTIDEALFDILNGKCSVVLQNFKKSSLKKKSLEIRLGKELNKVNSIEYLDGTIFFKNGKKFYTYELNEELFTVFETQFGELEDEYELNDGSEKYKN